MRLRLGHESTSQERDHHLLGVEPGKGAAVYHLQHSQRLSRRDEDVMRKLSGNRRRGADEGGQDSLLGLDAQRILAHQEKADPRNALLRSHSAAPPRRAHARQWHEQWPWLSSTL
jgi:hypothetical protein